MLKGVQMYKRIKELKAIKLPTSQEGEKNGIVVIKAKYRNRPRIKNTRRVAFKRTKTFNSVGEGKDFGGF